MFVDSVQISVASGKGGGGCVSFHREKFITQGGPDGGDGGKGGDVFFVASSNTDTLSHFRGKKKLKALNGENGSSKNKSGKKGQDLIIKAPLGTQIIDVNTGELLLDLSDESQKFLLLEGGKGGLGNARFKSSTNQRPTYAQTGIAGQSLDLRLELKLIADVGLVGFANVGKSTLISVISAAKPIIANYEFTTITPNLGIVDMHDYKSFVVADIPGLIEGASVGKGLGFAFLKHIERTKFLLFTLDVSNYRDLKTQYENLRKELENYSKSLASKPFAIAITKTDTSLEGIKEFTQSFKNKDLQPRFILPISSITKENIENLKQDLFKELNQCE